MRMTSICCNALRWFRKLFVFCTRKFFTCFPEQTFWMLQGSFLFFNWFDLFWQDAVLRLFSLKDVLHCIRIDCFCHESSVINVVVKRGNFWINFLSEHLLWKIKKNFRILWRYNNGSSGPNFFLGVLVLGIL